MHREKEGKERISTISREIGRPAVFPSGTRCWGLKQDFETLTPIIIITGQ